MPAFSQKLSFLQAIPSFCESCVVTTLEKLIFAELLFEGYCNLGCKMQSQFQIPSFLVCIALVIISHEGGTAVKGVCGECAVAVVTFCNRAGSFLRHICAS